MFTRLLGWKLSHTQFCFPTNSVACHTYPGSSTYWMYHNFVLTHQAGSRLYAHCLRFPEGTPDSEALLCLCVLSKQCYYSTMAQLLTHIVHFIEKRRDSKVRLFEFLFYLTFELSCQWSDILNFMAHSLVCPMKQKLGLVFSITGEFPLRRFLPHHPGISYQKNSSLSENSEVMSILFGMSPQSQAAFPPIDFEMSLLFSSLSVLNIIKTMECIMGECKLVFLSSRVRLLTNVTQSLITLLWPFSWVSGMANRHSSLGTCFHTHAPR